MEDDQREQGIVQALKPLPRPGSEPAECGVAGSREKAHRHNDGGETGPVAQTETIRQQGSIFSSEEVQDGGNETTAVTDMDQDCGNHVNGAEDRRPYPDVTAQIGRDRVSSAEQEIRRPEKERDGKQAKSEVSRGNGEPLNAAREPHLRRLLSGSTVARMLLGSRNAPVTHRLSFGPARIARSLGAMRSINMTSAVSPPVANRVVPMTHETVMVRSDNRTFGLACPVLALRLRKHPADYVRVLVRVRVEHRERHEQDKESRTRNGERDMVEKDAPAMAAVGAKRLNRRLAGRTHGHVNEPAEV